MLFADLSSISFYIAFFLNILYYLSCFFIKKHHRIFNIAITSLLVFSFGTFILSFVYSDFSLYSVYAHSHTNKPLIYKIGAAWSSHEGSMLFWLFIVSLYSLAYSIIGSSVKTVSHIQSFVQLILHSFVIITANPFQRLFPIPLEGSGFNPLLQDYALLIHPPILYLGYAASAISFSIVLAAAINKDLDWWKSAKNWIMLPWVFLTLGVGLGSWWSYRELGWGGFWAWDPVENVSLLPWFAALAFIHLTLIKQKNYLIHYLLKLNGILIFIFSIFSTFIVRSGMISSIHAFASDNERGWYFLILLGFFSILGFGIIIFYDKKIATSEASNKILFAGSILISLCYIIIISAIIVPIYLNIYHQEIVNIGEDFYQKIFGIIFIPMLILINIISYSGIKKLCFSMILSVIFFFIISLKTNNFIAFLNIFLASMVFFSYFMQIFEQILDKKRVNFASFLAHSGLSILIIGAITCSLNTIYSEKLIGENGEIKLGNYRAVLTKIDVIRESDSTGIKANFTIWHKNKELGFVYPKLKFYHIERMQLPDTASFYHYFSDIYILITGVDGDNNMIMTKVYYKPLVSFIWIGCLMIVASGFVCLIERRMRNSI